MNVAFIFFSHKYDFRKQLQRMLTNDKAADVINYFPPRPRGKKNFRLDSLASLTSFFLVFRERGPHRPTPLALALVTAFRVEQTCCRRIGDRELAGWALYLLIYIPRRPARAAPLYPAAAARAPGPRRGARPRGRQTPAAGTCCARPPGQRRGAAAPLSSSPVSARRRSSRRRRQLPGRGSAAERGLQRPGAGRLPAAATREAGSSGSPGCPRALPDWLAGARGPTCTARPPWLAGGPALRRPRGGGGARGGRGRG